jgi:hypothetical protein
MSQPVKWLLAFSLPVLLLLAVLSFGSAQWKYCYMWQAYVMEKEKRDIISMLHKPAIEYSCLKVPVNHTGSWQTWDEEGRLTSEIEYLNGKVHGMAVIFHLNGKIASISQKANGEYNGWLVALNQKGAIFSSGKLVDSYYAGLEFTYDQETFNLIKIDTWQLGTVVHVYDKSKKLDNRKQYSQEIADFKIDLEQFGKLHGVKP